MKKLFLFSTKLYYFLTLIPLFALLAIAIYLNADVKGIMKLYPLITVTIGGIIFTVLFFLRGILLTYDDARCVGLLSKKEHARYKKDYSLVITELRRGRLLVEVYGFIEAGGIGYDWYVAEKSEDINLLRARTNGNRKTVKKILRYYGFDSTDIDNALSTTDLIVESKDASFTSTLSENLLKVRITFKELCQAKIEEQIPKANQNGQ